MNKKKMKTVIGIMTVNKGFIAIKTALGMFGLPGGPPLIDAATSLVATISEDLRVAFFFSSRRRHTSSKRDWSSDVCSSDLDRLPRIFCRKEFCTRRLRRPAQPSKKVQLERCVGSKEQKVRFGLEVVFFSTTEDAIPLDLREQAGTRDGNLGTCGVDALRCELQIVVLLERCADEFLQLRVLEDLPPRKIGIGRRLSLPLGVFAQITEGRWRLNDGPMVVRPHAASSD